MECLWFIILIVAFLVWCAFSIYDIIQCTNSLFFTFKDINLSTKLFLGAVALLFAVSLVWFIASRG